MTTDNNWTQRVQELRQMVADVPVAPECASDADYYITMWGITDTDEVKFLRQEFARQYAPGFMHKWAK